MRDPEVNESKYRSRLVDEVKLVGRTLMENADDIVARAKFSTGLIITAKFEQGINARAPEIIVEQSFLPDPTELMELYNKSHEKVWSKEVNNGRRSES